MVPGGLQQQDRYHIHTFISEKEIPYDYRNRAQQQQIILEQFVGQGWRTAQLLEEAQRSENFY